MEERRKILESNMTEIPGRVMISEQNVIKTPKDLRKMIMGVIDEGLEGLVLKDSKSNYEPGKRHWLKMKKDYLDSGTMADTADLVVLGAYYGTGNKGGMKSVFLMGTYDEKKRKWFTVTKVGNGFDDKTLGKLQKQIEMVEIKKNSSKVPDWLDVHKNLIPDFVVKNPMKSPVWEIVGAEFSKSDTHSAAGISIRFPRVAKVRDDKSWKEATNIEQLKKLVNKSNEKTDLFEEKEKRPVKRSLDSENDDDEKTNKKIRSGGDELLPAIFNKKSFFIDSNVPDIKKLKRYIQA